jgi:hypothetical protein
MDLPSLACPYCSHHLSKEYINTPDLIKCPSCSTSIQIITFAALYENPAQDTADNITVEEGEAICFYHHNKRASVVCHMCGRFLCNLCNIELEGDHICTECIEKGRKERNLTSLENHRVLYDNIALALALYPVIFFLFPWFSFLTAPAALYISSNHWKSPGSILGGSKIRFTIAIILSLFQIVSWIIIPLFLYI